MNTKKRFWRVLGLCLVTIVLGGCVNLNMIHVQLPKAAIDNYPERPITLIVPYSPGGGIDLAARSLQTLSVKYLGQPLIVINKVGGGGALGWNEAADARRDGYTLTMTAVDMLLLPHYGPSKYDYPTAFSPLAQITAIPMLLVVKADSPWQTLGDLIDDAKQHPGKIKFGHAGVGAFAHILGETFGNTTGINIKQVPFNGGSEGLAMLLGGHLHFIFATPATVKDHIKGGTVRVLAITGEQRMADPVLAHIPTFKEQSVNISITNWFGVAAPLDTPHEIKAKLAAGFEAMAADPLFIENMAKIGNPVEHLGPEKTARKWMRDNKVLIETLGKDGLLEKIKEQRK